MFDKNSGYSGFSMSKRAVLAYANDEMPISKWTKGAILDALEDAMDDYEGELNITIEELKTLPLYVLKEYFLMRSSWHHTSKFCNSTDFYKICTSYLDESMAFFQQVVADHKRKLAETKAERKAKADAQAIKRAEKQAKKEFENMMQGLLQFSKYKTLGGFIRAYEGGRVNLDALKAEQSKYEEQRKFNTIRSWLGCKRYDLIEKEYGLNIVEAKKLVNWKKD